MSETEGVTQEQINAKKAEKKRLEGQKAACQARMDSLDDKIADVDRAIDDMEALERNFGEEKEALAKDIRGTSRFKGDNYDRMISGEGERLNAGMDTGKETINHAADALIDLRTELKNKKAEEYGIFEGLVKAYNSVTGWLRKVFN